MVILPPLVVEKLRACAPTEVPGAVFNFTISVDSVDPSSAARFLKDAGFDIAVLLQKRKP